MGNDTKTSRKVRNLLIRTYHDERHRLLDREHDGEDVRADLLRVEALIDKHEMDEYEEQTGPFRREQNRKLVELADKLRALVPADAMVPVDAAIARLLKEPEPDDERKAPPNG